MTLRSILTTLLAAAALTATMGPSRVAADLKVVATTPDLAAVAREVGGDHVEVTSMALHTQDPHFVDARPHLALALSRADLLIAVGLDLEVGWLPTLQTGSRNGDIQTGGQGYFDASRYVEKLEVPRGRVDRSEGDVHPGGNPHYMFDPRRVERIAMALGRRMARLDPSHAADYGRQAQRFVERLQDARARWERQLADLRGQKVVAYHKSFPYLADWLGFEIVEHVEPRPGIPPNPRHVAHVLSTARQHHVGILLQEAFYPESTSELIAGRADATLARIPGGPNLEEGETYIDFMNRVVQTLRRAMS